MHAKEDEYKNAKKIKKTEKPYKKMTVLRVGN